MKKTLKLSAIEMKLLDRMSDEGKRQLSIYLFKESDPRCKNKHRCYYEKTLDKFVCHICKTYHEVEFNV